MQWHDTEPRDKVWHQPEDAGFEDLLAVLLSQGMPGRDVLELSRAVARLAGSERGLLHVSPGALTAIKGIGKARATAILAAVELARRQNGGRLKSGSLINSRDLAYWLLHRLQGREHEYFCLFSFNRRFRLIRHHQLARGNADLVQIYLRDIVQVLLNDRASFAIIAHNHPESPALPSAADVRHMRKLEKLLQDMGIRLLDQMIAGEEGVYSCRRGRFVCRSRPGHHRTDEYALMELDRKIQYANPEHTGELEPVL
ncbi:MAG: JAB domain-containing protein [Leptospirales bacterium]|jgi:DNA repair protein RadC